VVGPLKDHGCENELVSDNEIMCEMLNEYFGSVITSENDMVCRSVKCLDCECLHEINLV